MAAFSADWAVVVVRAGRFATHWGSVLIRGVVSPIAPGNYAAPMDAVVTVASVETSRVVVTVLSAWMWPNVRLIAVARIVALMVAVVIVAFAKTMKVAPTNTNA